MLRLKLFGPGQIQYLDRTLPGFPQRQSCLLLCYLLLNRHTVFSREWLASLFWGDYDSAVARKYLRNTFWRLRQELEALGLPLEAYLINDEQRIGFAPRKPYDLDIERFEQTLHCYLDLPGETLQPDQAAALESAVQLYTGDLLDGLYEDWCLEAREQLRKLYFSGLNKLTAYHEAQGAYERAVGYAEKILAYDKVQERVHQRLMILHWRLGNRAAALAQYRCCVQILHDELGVGPMERTQQLYQQIAAQRPPPVRNGQLSGAFQQSGGAVIDLHHAAQHLHHLKTLVSEAQRELNALEASLAQAVTLTEFTPNDENIWGSNQYGADKPTTD